MPRFKPIDKGLKLLPVDFDKQVQPGSFEHALCHLIDHELDLSEFHARYRNDDQGAPAYDPAVLLKIILLAYSRGIVSSRRIEAACRENVLFMAGSGDSQPNFTTIADFVSGLGDLTAKLFAQVLTLCDRQGLIGREMFAIDGVKLPSNASKAKSGKHKDFLRQAEKMEKAARSMLAKHREADASQAQAPSEREANKLQRLQREARQMRDWLKQNPQDRKGSRGKLRLSNLTDNESAKPVLSPVEGMATSKGVIQGYCGVAAVDERHQIIVEAQAHGTGSEQALLMPVVEATTRLRTDETVITADAGYHSEANCKALTEGGIEAYLCDNDYRRRDERFADQDQHRAKPEPLYDKSSRTERVRLFRPADFDLAEDRSHCVCPAGRRLYSNGSNCTFNGYAAIKFQGAQRDCVPCALRTRCLRTPEKTKTRQVAFFLGRAPGQEKHADRMKTKIDSDLGKQMIARRFATVEPVFGNLRHNKRLDRFTLRGQRKVDAQWKLYCLTHNIEKLAHHGYAS
jgi:transposase